MLFRKWKRKWKGKKLIIEINLYGKEKESFTLDNPKREEINEEGHKTVISITGSKKSREYQIWKTRMLYNRWR